ncbi:MAG: hypothetical protein AAFY72_01935 [Cyanobacteria bacterium J06649_4]
MQRFLNRLFRGSPVFTGLFVLSTILLTLALSTAVSAQHTAVATSQPLFQATSDFIAQTSPRRVVPSAIAAQIYEQNPDFPLENQYISSDTGEPATENTLISRLVRYHVYIKRRPVHFRIDWKLTMADYLGAFERIEPARYPDSGLRENPALADVAVIEGLSAEMRDRIVNALYESFAFPASESANESTQTASPTS